MMNLLTIQNLSAYYAQSQVLHGLDLEIKSSEVVALLGRNGAGRSTCLKAIMGMVRAEGQIQYRDQSLIGFPSFKIAQSGIAYVPEDRAIFAGLTVEQNLMLGIKPPARAESAWVWRLDDAYALFPILFERRAVAAEVLSGGEQQMLTLARSLLGNPDLLLVDEPTEGLAPQVIAQLLDFFISVKQRGVAILLVEQKLELAKQIADRFLILGNGSIVFDGDWDELIENQSLRQEWLEI